MVVCYPLVGRSRPCRVVSGLGGLSQNGYGMTCIGWYRLDVLVSEACYKENVSVAESSDRNGAFRNFPISEIMSVDCIMHMWNLVEEHLGASNV